MLESKVSADGKGFSPREEARASDRISRTGANYRNTLTCGIPYTLADERKQAARAHGSQRQSSALMVDPKRLKIGSRAEDRVGGVKFSAVTRPVPCEELFGSKALLLAWHGSTRIAGA